MATLEKNIESRFRRKAKERGWLVYKFTSPGTRGVPDRIAVLPGGHVLFIEFKRPHGRLSVLQEKQIERLRRQGATVEVVWSNEDADVLLETYSC